MSAKQYLKAARDALIQNDPEGAIYNCDIVLSSIDKKNYFAMVFKSKALTILDQYNDAVKLLDKATSVEPDNLLAWKGLLAIVKENDGFEYFFKAMVGYCKALIANKEGLSEATKMVKVYMKNFKNVSGIQEAYYRNMIPSSELGELIGNLIDKYENHIMKLIDLLRSKESTDITTAVRKYKMKVPHVMNEEQKLQMNKIIWEFYKTSDVPSLYEQCINICRDDFTRRKIETDYIEYRYEILKVTPPEYKNEYFEQVREIVSGMVVVKHECELAWSLYFDWLDPVSINDLDLIELTNYIRIFGNAGLGSVFNAFLLSEISPFEKSKVNEILKDIAKESASKLKKSKRKRKGELTKEVDEESEKVTDEPETSEETGGEQQQNVATAISAVPEEELIPQFSQTDIIDMFTKGLEGASKSILAHRIVVSFYIHLGEYEIAIDVAKTLTSLVVSTTKDTSARLEHSRLDSSLFLAIIYTYYESPKNFPKAIKLYDRILSLSPDNISAKVGKGLIAIEKREYDEAKSLLSDVVKNHTDNFDALFEYSWCNIQLCEFTQGRIGLNKCYELIKGTDLKSFDLRAKTLYRLAQSYLKELDVVDMDEETVTQNVKIANDLLIKSLKQSKEFASSYTALGMLYSDFYGNESKALKCFYKAFELDPAEVYSAKQLVSSFSNKCDWEMVVVLCTRIIDSEAARRELSFDKKDQSWPYRMLGCAALERQDDSKAIEFYQNSLRISPNDIESWLGLGEAYFSVGRLESSSKVFDHVMEVDPENWYAQYLNAVVQAELGDYQDSVTKLRALHYSKKDELCVITSLYETLISKVGYEITTGFIGRSLDTSLEAFEFLFLAHSMNQSSQKLWKSLSDLLKLFLHVQKHISKIPFEKINAIIEKTELSNSESGVVSSQAELLSELKTMGSTSNINTPISEIVESQNYVEAVCICLIKIGQLSLSQSSASDPKQLRSSLTYNLGLSYLEAYKLLDDQIAMDCAIKCLRKAIQLENKHFEYWIALGHASVRKNPKVSQHCFIKASSLAPKEPSIWISLAVLYLHYSDFDLAKECFIRAQSIAPAAASSWTGQAFVAEANNELEKAGELLIHSYSLSNGTEPLSMLLYGLSIVKKLISSEVDPRDVGIMSQLNVACFAMVDYMKYNPNDTLALTVTLIILERIYDFDIAIELSDRLCDILEKLYENSEDPEILIGYTKAKSQLARIYIGKGNFEAAHGNSSFVLDVLGSSEVLTPEIEKCILSCNVVCGLSNYFEGKFSESLSEFMKCLEFSGGENRRIVVLVSQVLYSYDEEDTKQAAIDELFKNISEHGSSLFIVLTLAALSLVENIDEYLPVIRDEIASLDLAENINDSYRSIPFFLSEITERIKDKQSGIWQRAAFMFPSDVNVWERLSKDITLNIASTSNSVGSEKLSDAYIESGDLREIQRGLFFCPNNVNGYKALKSFIE
ncbi:hypothetical protein BVG19_g4771 [[Candida] boidinii]|nr:hypothetical protein BVG19_g4771 [[Candida] boidinii]OWB52679.1 hypothetical protein B5S27_g4260 [[Candida] boidinii]OWB67984.1 hypothetical protein B5S30_g3354 [[Candida] boidinii]